MKKTINKNLYDFNSPFPTILRKLIEEYGTKQDVIAEKCNVKRQTVAQWKDGNTCPDILSLKKIAEFYNVSTDYLLGLSTNPTTNEASKSMCKTLGLSDVAIEFLQNDTTNQMRSKINFIFENLNEINNLYRKFEKEGTNK